MRLLSVDRIMFFRRSGQDGACGLNTRQGESPDVSCRPVLPETLDDVLSYRTADVRETFAGYLRQGRSGTYAYQGDKVVGHVWMWSAEGGELSATMGVDAPVARRRKLFGWIPLPDDWDFLYFCRATSDLALDTLLAYCIRRIEDGRIVGISLPRNDKMLLESVRRMGFSYSHTYTRVSLFGFTLFQKET